MRGTMGGYPELTATNHAESGVFNLRWTEATSEGDRRLSRARSGKIDQARTMAIHRITIILRAIIRSKTMCVPTKTERTPHTHQNWLSTDGSA
jgi:hypothetical protein